ncbi:unnamed protein product [Dicrocoelium dendriticum]|nr:unnamed protein product [Dicrocoelium dendriticum]
MVFLFYGFVSSLVFLLCFRLISIGSVNSDIYVISEEESARIIWKVEQDCISNRTADASRLDATENWPYRLCHFHAVTSSRDCNFNEIQAPAVFQEHNSYQLFQCHSSSMHRSLFTCIESVNYVAVSYAFHTDDLHGGGHTLLDICRSVVLAQHCANPCPQRAQLFCGSLHCNRMDHTNNRGPDLDAAEDRNSPSRLLEIIFPVIMIALNVAIFMNILRVILLKMKAQPSSETSRIKTFLKSTSVLVLIFGLYHVVFVPLDLMESQHGALQTRKLELIKLYYRQVMEALQGFCAALLLCFTSREVICELKRYYRTKQVQNAIYNPSRHGSYAGTGSKRHLINPNNPVTQNTQPSSSGCFRYRDLYRNILNKENKVQSFHRPSGPRKPSALCMQQEPAVTRAKSQSDITKS